MIEKILLTGIAGALVGLALALLRIIAAKIQTRSEKKQTVEMDTSSSESSKKTTDKNQTY